MRDVTRFLSKDKRSIGRQWGDAHLSMSILWEDVLENLRNATPCFIVVARSGLVWASMFPVCCSPSGARLERRPKSSWRSQKLLFAEIIRTLARIPRCTHHHRFSGFQELPTAYTVPHNAATRTPTWSPLLTMYICALTPSLTLEISVIQPSSRGVGVSIVLVV